jgi:hypothetical protein
MVVSDLSLLEHLLLIIAELKLDDLEERRAIDQCKRSSNV